MTKNTCPHCGSPVEADATGCGVCFGALLGPGAKPIMLAAGDDWMRQLPECQVLGGYGVRLPLARTVTARFDAGGVTFVMADGAEEAITLDTITGIEIGGPGKVTSGGGFIGGGFGLDGAAAGMFVAAALNAISTRTQILTVLSIFTRDSEVWLAYGRAEPAALRVELAPVFVAVRRNGVRP